MRRTGLLLALLTVSSVTYVHAQCVAGFTFNVNGPSVAFTNTSSGASLPLSTWYFGDATTDYSVSPTHSYQTAGTYNVKLVYRDSMGSCIDSMTTAITVTAGCNYLSVGNSGTPASSCNACDGTMSGVVSGGTAPYVYQWSNSATTVSQSNVCPGFYTLTVTDANGCTATTTTQVACPDSCHANFTFWANGNTAYFTNTSNDTASFVQFQWYFGDASSSNMTSPSYHTYSTTGTYNVTLVMVDPVNQCTDTSFQTVSVGGPNSCSAGFNLLQDSLNPGQWYGYGSAAGQPPFSYLWDFGDTTTSTMATPSHNYAYPTVHHVICLTITDANSCSSTYCDSSMTHRLNSTGMQSLTVVSMTTPSGLAENGPSVNKVWPNPATDVLHVSFSSETAATIILTDLEGRIVMQRTFSGSAVDLNTSGLPQGSYNLSIIEQKGRSNHRVIITR